MARLGRILLTVLAVPLLAYVVGQTVQGTYDRDWRSALEDEFGPISDAAFERVALPVVCANPTLAPDAGLCGEYGALGWAQRGALASGLIGIAAVFVISATARAARGDRSRLVTVFRPALYLTIAVLIVLAIVDGLLVMASIYFGEGLLLGVTHPGVIAGVGLAALVAVLGMVGAALRMTRSATASVVGRGLSREAQPGFLAFVEDLAAAVGAEPPHNVVAGLDPAFFVTEVDVRTLDGLVRGRTMYVSVPLCRILSVPELRAIVGHELAHFMGSDTRFSQRFYPIYRGATDSYVALQASSRGLAAVALAPAMSVIAFFLESFATAEGELARERELAADQVGARAAGADAMGSSLFKLTALTETWDETLLSLGRALVEGRSLANAAETYAQLARAAAVPGRFDRVDSGRLSHPTDSHPPLSRRLHELGLHRAVVAEPAADVTPARPATGLFVHESLIERDLTAVLNARLAATLGVVRPPSDAVGAEAGAPRTHDRHQPARARAKRIRRARAGGRGGATSGDS